ncbi:MAG: cysteine desulfurase [Bdellovibrionales bacterium]|nr:cysteine desulfurase [Bdellovibrionales bacterium]
MDSISKPIYLDYNSTTPVDPQVFAAMEPYFKTHFGNPSSFAHQWGWAAQKAVDKARVQLSDLIGTKPLELTFTGGATESNNWVVFGLIEKFRAENRNEPIHIIASHIEHSSVMNSLKEAQRRGVEVDFVKTNKYGQVEVETVAKAIKPHTKLMSFIWVNNEIGSINPIRELAQLAKEKQIYIHTDATQAVGKIPVNVQEAPVDLLSASAHKFYGPKGIGFLYVRSAHPKVSLPPFIFGGGQEHGNRSGTHNVPGIVGLGAAAEICHKQLPEEYERTTELRNYLWMGLQQRLPSARLNGHPTERSPINLNITFPGKNIEQLLPKLGRLGFSQGSACHTGTLEVSPMLVALGLTPEEAQGTLRLSLGRWTTKEDLDTAIEVLAKALN